MVRKLQLQTNRTVLVVVEGHTELAFCLYLKALAPRENRLHVTIRNAHGGSPESMMHLANRLAKQGSYDQIVMVFDADVPLTPKAQALAKKLKAKCFLFEPCIEGFFLTLMGRAKPATTLLCKSHFHQHGLDDKQKLDRHSYEELFPSTRFGELCANSQFAALWSIFEKGE
jgi:hypothetical protein